VAVRDGFDAIGATRRLQEAIRAHDRSLVNALVSERLVLTSRGATGSMGKTDFMAAALAIDWQYFRLAEFHVLELGDACVVEYTVEQELRPANGSRAQSTWVTTDVWAREGRGWRLVHRHPELLVSNRDHR
jgi:ketosteroid isomerase-like protein